MKPLTDCCQAYNNRRACCVFSKHHCKVQRSMEQTVMKTSYLALDIYCKWMYTTGCPVAIQNLAKKKVTQYPSEARLHKRRHNRLHKVATCQLALGCSFIKGPILCLFFNTVNEDFNIGNIGYFCTIQKYNTQPH